MSNSESQVFLFDSDDPEMHKAYERAQQAFPFFLREMTWEMRRIIPACEVACVKACFSDPVPNNEKPKVEWMWIDEVNFDGVNISGVLLNSPNWVTSVSEGDRVQIPFNRLGDWMYSIVGHVYGGFTINLMRSRMPADERATHDDAWDMDFGDPHVVDVTQPSADGTVDLNAEHPMALNMATMLEEHLKENPQYAKTADENGWTVLHEMALGGSAICCNLLLKYGADPNARTATGQSPLALAKTLGWNDVANLLALAKTLGWNDVANLLASNGGI